MTNNLIQLPREVKFMSKNSSSTFVLIVTSIIGFIYPFMVSSINVALPAISKEFSMPAVILGWVTTSYTLVSAALQIPMGRLADILGRKKIFTIGLIIQLFATFFCGVANSPAWLISARVVQAIGASMTFSTTMALLSSAVAPQARGKAIGTYMSIVYIGMSVGPFVGGVMTQHLPLGWRSIFFLNLVLCLVLVILIFWKLKEEWIDAKGEKYDALGAIAYTLSLGILMYGFSNVVDLRGKILIPVGIVSITAFAWLETRVKSPVLNISLFKRNTTFLFSNLATMINYGSTGAISFFLSIYLQTIKGMSPQIAGLILITQPVIMVITAFISSRYTGRIEPRRIASAGMAFTCVGLALLALLNQASALVSILGGLIMVGIGFGLFISPNTEVVMGSVDKRYLGVASGVIGTMRSIGGMVSMGTAIILFSIYLGSAQIIPQYFPAFMTSLRAAFIVFSILCFVGIFTQLAGSEVKAKIKAN